MIHVIVDYTYLYYKYKFALQHTKMPRHPGAKRDMSIIYYTIQDIERFRKEQEKKGDKVIVSVCFDMPSVRAEDTEYKALREKYLTDEDYDSIHLVEEILREANYNTYRISGFEADDIIGNLVVKYAKNFDMSVIYTPDADLLAYVRENVMVMRHKIGVGYTPVSVENFREYASKECKCEIPYNAIVLYKSTVGDKSDNIQGITKFGPKAFDRLVEYLSEKGVEWEKAGEYSYTEKLLEMAREYLGEEKFMQAINSLRIVRYIDNDDIAIPNHWSCKSDRVRAYGMHKMNSLNI